MRGKKEEGGAEGRMALVEVRLGWVVMWTIPISSSLLRSQLGLLLLLLLLWVAILLMREW